MKKKLKSTKRVPIAIQLLKNQPKVVARPKVSRSEKIPNSMYGSKVVKEFFDRALPEKKLDRDIGLPKAKSKFGYTEAEVKDILFERFGKWMRGQTMMLMKDGTSIYYTCDVYRYVNGLPVID